VSDKNFEIFYKEKRHVVVIEGTLKGLSNINQGESKVAPIDRYQCSVWLLGIFFFLKGLRPLNCKKCFKGLKTKNVAYTFP
jgi:hypothetical protein